MGLLDRIRAWLTGGSEAGQRDGDDGTEAEEPSLDPEKVTEVRTESDDDPLEKLRELEADADAGDTEAGGPADDAAAGVDADSGSADGDAEGP